MTKVTRALIAITFFAASIVAPTVYAGCASDYSAAVAVCGSIDGFFQRQGCYLDADGAYFSCVYEQATT
jgi:hypothetical protein